MTTQTLDGYEMADLESAAAHCGPALDALAGASILITGGTGFFGQWLVATLIHANRTRGLKVEITLPTRSLAKFALRAPELANDPFVTLVEGDIRTLKFTRPRFSHVIHAATDTSVEADANPLLLLDTIVSGTRRVLDIANAAGARDVLYVSSGGVYGGQGELERVPESFRGACNVLDRRSVYGEAKRMAEMLCSIYRVEHSLKPRIARCFAFVGPGLPLDAHFAIGNFIADAIAGRTIEIKGDGTQIRSYLYAGDLVAWLLRTLVLGREGVAYNVGSDAGLGIAELARAVVDVIPSATGVQILGVPQLGGFRSRYVPAVDLARKELGVEIWTPLPAAIRATADWARNRASARTG